MSDLTNPALIKLKGILFVLLGTLSAGLIVLDRPKWKIGLLLALAIWSFCRFYYFSFYVIQHYVDPSYRFSGLLSIAGYLMRKHRRGVDVK